MRPTLPANKRSLFRKQKFARLNGPLLENHSSISKYLRYQNQSQNQYPHESSGMTNLSTSALGAGGWM